MDLEQLARSIDHTVLAPDTTPAAIRQLCDEARRWGFAAVCVNPRWVPLAVGELAGSAVTVATVAGFPLGATTTAAKAFEAAAAVAAGAGEVDMVLDLGHARAGAWDAVQEDVTAVAQAVHAGGGRLKVILECCLLDDAEIEEAARRAVAGGGDFVKTSTGFASGGATVHDVALLRRTVGPDIGVKASGGIRGLGPARAMLAAGASRLGTSAGVRILEEARAVQAAR